MGAAHMTDVPRQSAPILWDMSVGTPVRAAARTAGVPAPTFSQLVAGPAVAWPLCGRATVRRPGCRGRPPEEPYAPDPPEHGRRAVRR